MNHKFNETGPYLLRQGLTCWDKALLLGPTCWGRADICWDRALPDGTGLYLLGQGPTVPANRALSHQVGPCTIR